MHFVDIPGLRVLSSEYSEGQIVIRAAFPDTDVRPSGAVCIHCGRPSDRPVHVRPEQQEFLDIPIHGAGVRILIDRPRILCKHCRSIGPLTAPFLHESLKVTTRLFERCFDACLVGRFEHVAEELSLDLPMVRAIFRRYLQEMAPQRRFKVPAQLGLEMIFAHRVPILLIIDVLEARIIDVLEMPDRDKVTRYFEKMPDHHHVKMLIIDTWFKYRDIALTIFSEARTVADGYHVSRMANHAVEAARQQYLARFTPRLRQLHMNRPAHFFTRRLQLKPRGRSALALWATDLPEVLTAYNAKEQLLEIWDEARSYPEVANRYRDWKAKLPLQLEEAFRMITDAVERDPEAIFSRGNDRAPQRYTALLHRVNHLVARAGLDFEREALIPKLLFTDIGRPELDGDTADFDDCAVRNVSRLLFSSQMRADVRRQRLLDRA